MATLRCKEPFSCDINGVPRTIAAGALVDSADPIVVGREALFESVDAFVSRQARVEEATAEPGEKRSLTRRKPSRD